MIRISKKYYLTLFAIVICLNTQAQFSKVITTNSVNNKQNSAVKSEIRFTECTGLAIPELDIQPLLLNIKNLERKHTLNQEIEIIKQQKTSEKLKDSVNGKIFEHEIDDSFSASTIGTNFKGNIFNGGAPPDNTIAVSDAGIIVSVINCNIAYYNSRGNQLYTGSL